MELVVYGKNANLENSQELFKTNKYKNYLMSKKNSVYKMLSAISEEEDFYFSINNNSYNLLDLYPIEIKLKKIGRLFLVFKEKIYLEKIRNKLNAIHSLPSTTDEEKLEKLSQVIKALEAEKPLLILTINCSSYIKKISLKNKIIILCSDVSRKEQHKKQIEDQEPKQEKKSDTALNIVLVTLFPILITCMTYTSIMFYEKEVWWFAILMTVISALLIGGFGYSLILIDEGKRYRKFFSINHIVLHVTTLLASVVGFGIMTLLDFTLFSDINTETKVLIPLIVFLSSLVIFVILTVSMYFLSKPIIKFKERRNKNKQ